MSGLVEKPETDEAVICKVLLGHVDLGTWGRLDPGFPFSFS